MEHTCDNCLYGDYYKNHDITTMEECGGCCSWNDKWQPKETNPIK